MYTFFPIWLPSATSSRKEDKMYKLIDLSAYSVNKQVKALLRDNTTKKNIILATSIYGSQDSPIREREQMNPETGAFVQWIFKTISMVYE